VWNVENRGTEDGFIYENRGTYIMKNGKVIEKRRRHIKEGGILNWH